MYYFEYFELHTTYCIDGSLLQLYATFLLPDGIKLFETDSLLNIGIHRYIRNPRESSRMAEEAKREEAKRIRTSAKARFTRKRNEFFKSIEENNGMEAVKRTIAYLHEAWNIVKGKHDIYMIHLAEEEVEQNETWLNELQEFYEEAATTHTQYVNGQTLREQKRVEEIQTQESMRIEHEKLRRLLEQFSMVKKSVGTIFDTLVKHANEMMESQNKDVNAPEALRKTERDLDIALTDCKALHNTMLELLNHENVEKEIDWIP